MSKPDLPKGLYWRGDVIWGRTSIRGKDVRGSLETSSVRTAKAKFKEWKRKQRSRLLGVEENLFYEDLLKLYMEKELPRKSARTVEHYQKVFSYWSHILPGALVVDIGPEQIDEFVEERRDMGNSDRTIINYIQPILSLMKFAIRQQLIRINPVRDYVSAIQTGNFKRPVHRRRICSPDEQALVQNRAERSDAIAFEFAIEMGLRPSEQWNVDRHRDLRMREGANGRLIVRDGKGGKLREVPLTRRAAQLLARAPIHPDHGYLFWDDGADQEQACRNARRRMRTLWRTLGIDGLQWRDLRRTCGCRLLRRGMQMEYVKEFLGHESMATTEAIYAFMTIETVDQRLADLEGDGDGGGADVVPLRRAT